jgi:hypothetical protein
MPLYYKANVTLFTIIQSTYLTAKSEDRESRQLAMVQAGQQRSLPIAELGN